jgi:hypothetical protein
MFTKPTRQRLVNLAIVAAMVTATLPALGGSVLANDNPEFPPPPAAEPIANAQVQAIAQDALDAFKYTFAVVAADPRYASYPEGSLEAGILAGLAGISQERQANFTQKAQQLLSAPPEQRMREVGRHGLRSPEEVRRLGFNGLFVDVPFDARALDEYVVNAAAAYEAQAQRDEATAMAVAKAKKINPVLIPQMTLKKLELRLEQVLCVDETNPETIWPGINIDDEISMGGLTMDHLSLTTKIPSFEVGDSFDDGESKSYPSPGKLFSSFDLTVGGTWGRTYTTTLMMAETDSGGFESALNDSWDKLKDMVAEEIEEAVTSGESDSIAEIIAETVAEVLKYLTIEFVEWVISWFGDDLFPPVTYSVTLPSKYSWMYIDPAELGWTNGKLPSSSVYFNGHGGQYRANVHYEVKS